MASKLASLTILSFLILLTLISNSNAGDIVVYWGQNGEEGKLRDTCASGNYKIVNIAFLSSFGNNQPPTLNLAGHCDPASNDCQKLSDSIKFCQSQNIKVLLSIGGAGGSYSLMSQSEAISVANYLWDNYLGGSSQSRPLGDVVLDGIDFDIEQGESFYEDLARKLTELGQNAGKKPLLTAAPQCPFPDQHLKGALGTGLFDYIWIQFYNNNCQYTPSDPSQFKKAWTDWTTQIKATKFYVGLPAAGAAARSGYVPANVLISEVLPFVKQSGDKYGGIMLWNKYYDSQNQYSSQVRGSV